MNAVRIPLREVTHRSRDFTVLASLETIKPPALAQNEKTTYQKLLFRDAEGTAMSATLFDKDIEDYSTKLKEGTEYEIKNPGVSLAPSYGRDDAKKYQLTINDRTTIDEVPQHTITRQSFYVPLTSCYDYLQHQGRIDIIGIAVHVGETRRVLSTYKETEYDTRDVILIDKSMVQKKLTLWHGFVEKEAQEIADLIDSQPIVTATQVRAGKFGGGNWSSTFFSTIKANDAVPEVEELKQWAHENTEEIKCIRESLRNETAESSAQRRPAQIGNTKTIISIANLNELDEGVTIWIQGRIADIINLDRCFYTSCNTCPRKTETKVGDTFICDKESPPHTGTAVYRYDLRIVFTDETASTKITLFSDLAESVLKRTAEEIAAYSPDEHQSFVDEIMTSIKTRTFAIKLVTFRIEGIRKQMKFRTLRVEEIVA